MVIKLSNENYKKIVDKVVPKENKVKNAFISFVVGGFIGLFGQVIVTILENNYAIKHNDATTIMIIILIFISCLLTGLGFFDDLVSKAKAGLIVPITGFAHAMTSAMLEYKKEGLVTGIGMNAFKLAGSVILYGTISAYFLGVIKYLVFGG